MTIAAADFNEFVLAQSMDQQPCALHQLSVSEAMAGMIAALLEAELGQNALAMRLRVVGLTLLPAASRCLLALLLLCCCMGGSRWQEGLGNEGWSQRN